MGPVDPVAVEASKVCLFVARLPFSRPPCVEPTPDMKQDARRRCHVCAFSHSGGSTPRRIAPDNLKAGQAPPQRGRGRAQRRLSWMAARYGATVMPARVRAPRDKPSVENEVWQVTTETFAAPRNRAFVNMGEPKAAVAERLREHGPRPLSEREETRRQVLEEQERPLARLRTDVFPDRWDDLYPWVIDELLRIRKVTSSL